MGGAGIPRMGVFLPRPGPTSPGLKHCSLSYPLVDWTGQGKFMALFEFELLVDTSSANSDFAVKLLTPCCD